MRFVLVVAACGLMLGGCLRAARHERELSEAGPKEDAFCREIGARPGSDAYVNCRSSMRQSLIQKQATENASAKSSTTCINNPGIGVTCF